MRGIPVVVGGMVAAAAVLAACEEAVPFTAGDTREDVKKYQVNRGIGRLVVRADAGSVHVGGTEESGSPRVTEELHYDDRKPRTSHEIDGDTLVLTATCPSRHQRRCWVDYTVTVGESVEVVAQTGAGNVVVDNLARSVDASTHAGDVRGSNLAASSVTARSDAGGVELEFVSRPNAVEAATSAGDVTIRLPSGTYAVEAETEVGDRMVEVPVDSGSQRKVRARTEVGDVKVLAAR